jgi:hypothetical protein
MGSLPRPPDMLETLRAIAAGQAVDMAAYEAALANHVADTVKKQVEAGIDTVTDGECSKPSFQQYVAERLAGFEPRMPASGLGVPTGPIGLDGRDAQMFPDFYRNVLENNPFRNTIRIAPAPRGYAPKAAAHPDEAVRRRSRRASARRFGRTAEPRWFGRG